MTNANEMMQFLLDRVASGQLSRHQFITVAVAAGVTATLSAAMPRVHGLRGLRVADASVMPSIISGPTNAPAFMIGGRPAELIKITK